MTPPVRPSARRARQDAEGAALNFQSARAFRLLAGHSAPTDSIAVAFWGVGGARAEARASSRRYARRARAAQRRSGALLPTSLLHNGKARRHD